MMKLKMALVALAGLAAGCAGKETSAPVGRVSFTHDVMPLLREACTECHNPDNSKKAGKLDLTTYRTMLIGGKKKTPFAVGEPDRSLLIQMISGDKPEMPEPPKPPLKKERIELLARWIREGAKDDTPEKRPLPTKANPPVYQAPPVISALAWAPDGKTLAVSGYHEVVLHKPDGSGIVDRLIGDSRQISSLTYSIDGKWLVVAGGTPAEFGEVQVWDAASDALVRSFRKTNDMIFGISLSPDASKAAFGCADNTVFVIDTAEGKPLLKCENHNKWVTGTAFTVDGKRMVTAGRDNAMKLFDLADGRFMDDINKLLEPVLCAARHPRQDFIVYGGALGTPRVYRIAENPNRTSANNDTNLVREFERQPGPVRAVAYGPDGEVVAVGGVGSEVRLYSVKDGKRTATLEGHEGAVFAIAFHPEGKIVATGGHDGHVRLFDAGSGKLVTSFVPVPLQEKQKAQR